MVFTQCYLCHKCLRYLFLFYYMLYWRGCHLFRDILLLFRLLVLLDQAADRLRLLMKNLVDLPFCHLIGHFLIAVIRRADCQLGELRQ